ncbi:hypothetical protein NDU88_002399 [Pleurodeles waltl]|uniref:Uncharacterized protein n=1 Tax=Pleurodeles waltl TaxID=8319 RepID=A0AAV7TN53_PLEWA|nr:hypothetical protein NDU88_002399 [Pleurodeles waltl]
MIPGAEGRSNNPGENDTEDIGNPDDRIPVFLPGQQTEEDAITIPGNPDIRVPDGIKREDGLRARGALGREDAKEEGAERGRGTEKRSDRAQEEEQKEASSEDNPKGREGPEEPELCHVPGGTWLSQTEEDAITIPGNPDIWVPNGIEREDGLCACSVLGREDAKEEGAERRGGTEKRSDRAQEEEQKEASSEDNPKGREGPEEPERHHAPGGTWLSQPPNYSDLGKG